MLLKNMVSQKGIKLFSEKQIDVALKSLDKRKDLIKARDQGGIIVVEAEGVLITAYRLDSFNHKLARS